ncbi:7473_t:CDS:2, partial [Cetraspora pellucida]
TLLGKLSVIGEQILLLLTNDSSDSLEGAWNGVDLLDDKMNSLVDNELDIDILEIVIKISSLQLEMFLPVINNNN